MRILALDVGDRRIGVAVTDPLGLTAQPLEVWERRTLEDDLHHFSTLAGELRVTAIVVGHPLTLAGAKSAQTAKVEAFAQALERQCGCPLALWDERLTSVAGERTLLEGNVSRATRRVATNQVAAILLLQHYVESHRNASTP